MASPVHFNPSARLRAYKTFRMLDPTNYGICPKNGFLSSKPPATAFKDRYYQPWDDIIPRLSSLIANGELEKAVAGLPLLSMDRLKGEVEYRRAYVILGFLIHGHVWCRSPPNQHVPSQMAEPFLGVCAHLRMHPVLSYAGLCSWNWRVRNGAGMALANIDALASFTGARGEAAFYHVPVLIEAEGGHLIQCLLEAIEEAQCGRVGSVLDALNDTLSTLARMGQHLGEFYGVLQPEFFYNELRPFLAGGKGMESKGLPDGMIFQRADGSEIAQKLVGGSAAQSSLFPFLDVVLGVGHEDRTVFDGMRAYMPGAHRDFLDEVARLPSLRAFVEAHNEEQGLIEIYDKCLQQLRSWRGKHIAVVSKYIVQPARQTHQATEVSKIETSGPAETEEEWELQGTGGSALIPFLRQARDDTVGLEGPNRVVGENED